MKNPNWHRDEIILALDLYFDKDRGAISPSNRKIIELSKILNRLPIIQEKPDEAKFRNPNGVSLKLSNFLAVDPNYNGEGMSRGSKLDKQLFNEYSSDLPLLKILALKIKKIVEDEKLLNELKYVEEDETSDTVNEGKVIYKLHKIRERDTKIIKAKKEAFKKINGRVYCEKCGFDFEKTYGAIGKDFIECHHIIPLHKFDYIKTTKLEDLMLLCSNCHRMEHRRM